ncbi:MAG: hypothetical protein E2O52_03370 [Gammaproteobacteria bacterium]|nr:MAG: hypothetical protein E2O52_03370 [Gammaproteobacteria bacterium]
MHKLAKEKWGLASVCLVMVAATAAVDVDAPDAVAAYDGDLCTLSQSILLNARPGQVDIVVDRAARGSGFGTLQMNIDEEHAHVVVAMLTEEVEVDGQTLAASVWCKQVNQDRVNDVLGAQLEGPPRSCRDVNEHTYRQALATLTIEQRRAYDSADRPLRFVDDYNAGAGAAWIPSVVNDYIEWVDPAQDDTARGEQAYLRVQAPSVQVPWDSQGRDWYKGTHHCKVITLAAMRRWMTVGALAGSTELFPRANPVCTQPSRMTSVVGSCIQFFGPADATFCTDYSGAGWTTDAASAQCAGRHVTKAAWLATERNYVGTGGLFSTLSCEARDAISEVRQPPIRMTESGHFGTCVFRCNQADESLWHSLTGVPVSNQGRGGMQRACDLFIEP